MARLIARAPYRGLFAAETLTNTAYIALASGLAIKVGQQTQNSALVALLVALNALPVLVLSQFVTPTIERVGFYRVLIWTQVVALVAMGVTATLYALGTMSFLAAFFLIAVIGSTLSFHVPAVFGTLAWFVGERQVPQGVSSINLRTGITWIGGPLLGATLIGIDNGAALIAVGIVLCTLGLVPYLANRRLFLEHQAELDKQRMHDPECVLRAVDDGIENADLNGVCMLTQAPVRSGIAYLRLLRQPTITFIMVLYMVLYVGLGIYSILLATWGSVTLGVAAMAVGTLYSVRSLSSIPGPLITDAVLNRLGMSRTLVISTVVLTASILIAMNQHSLNTLAWIGLIIYGAVFFTLTSGVMTTLVTVTVGKEQRAEGAALYAAVKGIVSIPFVFIGAAATAWSPAPVLATSAVVGLAFVLIMRFGTKSRWNQMIAEYHSRLASTEASST
jgi:MFS family permease